jgi:tetratricopeptide (TPR) repeat protein
MISNLVASNGYHFNLFINYASEDRPLAKWLAEKLRDAGFIVWFDRQNIEGGDGWKAEIDEGLRTSSALISIVTAHSADPKRTWVRYEQTEARRLLLSIFPLQFEQVALPDTINSYQSIDFISDRDAAFATLIDIIRRKLFRAGQKLIDMTPGIDRIFMGRDAELYDIFKIIQPQDTKSVSTGSPTIAIQGMGGQGKTMLAEELVRRIGRRFPGGVIVEYRSENPPSHVDVLQRWAEYALGERPKQEYNAAQVRALFQQRGAILVMIDDVWQGDFGDHSKSAPIMQLLDALPPDSTRILTTRFGKDAQLIGARVYELSGLNADEGVLLMRNRLANKNVDAPEDLLRRLVKEVDGHPLALELAAGRSDHLRDLETLVERIAAGPQHDIEELELELEVVSRRNSLAISFRESLRALEEADKRLTKDWARRFRALGVFPDGALLTKELVGEVWGDDPGSRETERALQALQGRALLNRDQATGEYNIHPLLRSYSYNLLMLPETRHEEQQAVDRYIGCISRLAGDHFTKPPQEWANSELYLTHLRHIGDILYDLFKADFGDLDALVLPTPKPEQSVSPSQPRSRLMIAAINHAAEAIHNYVTHRPETAERGLRWLKLGLIAARAAHRQSDEAMFLADIGNWYRLRGNKADDRLPMLYFQRALDIHRSTANKLGEALVLSLIGELLRSKEGDFVKSLETHETAIGIYRELGDKEGEARALVLMGEAHWSAQNMQGALEIYEQAIGLMQSLNDVAGEADLRNKIASVYFNSGEQEKAIPLFEEAIELHMRVNNEAMLGEDYNDIGVSYLYLHQPQKALEYLPKAIKLLNQVGNVRVEAIAINNLAGAYEEIGDYDTALGYANEALAKAEQTSRPTMATVLRRLGEIYAGKGDGLRALQCTEEALTIARTADSKRALAGILGQHGWYLHKFQGKTEEGIRELEEVIVMMAEPKNQVTQAIGGKRITDFEQMLLEMKNALKKSTL